MVSTLAVLIGTSDTTGVWGTMVAESSATVGASGVDIAEEVVRAGSHQAEYIMGGANNGDCLSN